MGGEVSFLGHVTKLPDDSAICNFSVTLGLSGMIMEVRHHFINS